MVLEISHLGFQRIQKVADLSPTLVVDPAHIRELRRSSGSVQQSDVQSFFQASYFPAHEGRGNVERIGRGGEAAVLDNRHELPQSTLISHCCCSGIMLEPFLSYFKSLRPLG